MRPRVLVVGVGTVLMGDDGFGIEVVRRLADTVLPDWVQLADHGIGCGRLDRDLLGDYDTTILLDATPRGGVPGQLHLIEADLGAVDEFGDPGEVGSALPALLDPHGIRPDAAVRLLRVLGGDAGRLIVVGCEPEKTTGIGLSRPVADAVADAVRLVTDLVWGEQPAQSRSAQPRSARPRAGLPPADAESPRQLEPMGGE